MAGAARPIFTTETTTFDETEIWPSDPIPVRRLVEWMTTVSRRKESQVQPSDPTGDVRPSQEMTKIDRIDERGNIREHFTRDGRHTICGIEIGMRQQPCGNAPCKRCEKIVARLSEATGRGVMEMQTR